MKIIKITMPELGAIMRAIDEANMVIKAQNDGCSLVSLDIASDLVAGLAVAARAQPKRKAARKKAKKK